MSSSPFNMGLADWTPEPSTSGAHNPIRPSLLGGHQMPEPSRSPWNPAQMPWTTAAHQTMFHTNDSSVVEFKGDICSDFAATNKFVHKRKADSSESVAFAPTTKRQITDDHMADHLNSLHISNDFTTHQLQPQASSESSTTSATPSSSSIDQQQPMINVPMTTKDLQRKLRNAQRITLCDQIRRIQSEPLLPGTLLQRIERPCTALVLWQPPPKDGGGASSSSSSASVPGPPEAATRFGAGGGIDHNMNADENVGRAGSVLPHPGYDAVNNQLNDDEGIEDDFGLDNNNSSAVDLNISMDMEL